MTLTLDPAAISGDPVAFRNLVFGKLRVYLLRHFKAAPQYIRILEFQKNGSPHFHVLIDRYVPQGWLSKSWVAVGGGPVVDIRFVDVHRVTNYLSKYLTKELLLSAPKGSRRITTSRGIQLFEKPTPNARWTLLRVPIFELLGRCASAVQSISFDEEGVLEGFSTFVDQSLELRT